MAQLTWNPLPALRALLNERDDTVSAKTLAPGNAAMVHAAPAVESAAAVAPGDYGALSTSERVGMPCGPSERGERSGSSLAGSPSSQQLEPFQAIRMVGSGGPQPATREIETRREPASDTAGVLCGEIEDRLGFMAPDGACATPPPATAPIGIGGEKAAPDGLPREKPAMRPGDLGDRAACSSCGGDGYVMTIEGPFVCRPCHRVRRAR